MKVKSVQEFLTLIEKLNNYYTIKTPDGGNSLIKSHILYPHFIFRGHSDKAYEILPGVLRWKKSADGRSVESVYSMAEFNILNDFIGEASRFINNIAPDDFVAWLEISQHFGVPTRLLDFTENPLIALYFACVDKPEKDGVIWIIDEHSYNRKFHSINGMVRADISKGTVNDIIFNEIIMPQNIGQNQFPWIYKPYYREERMNMQSSVFMLWGHKINKLTDFLDSSDYMTFSPPINNQTHGIIGRIEISKKIKQKVLQQLNLLGINEKFVYPGLDGIGKHIKKKYS